MKSFLKSGVFSAIGAYTIWGFLPLYWLGLKNYPASTILAHRVLWVSLSLGLFVFLGKRLRDLKNITASPKILGLSCLASVLIGANWFIYIWAVNNGHVVESSLGYYLNPLLSVCLGVVVLGERLRPLQILSATVAAVGIAFQVGSQGKFPWIAFALAGTFGFYGLLKKQLKLPSLVSLLFETLLLLPLCLFYFSNAPASAAEVHFQEDFFGWNGLFRFFQIHNATPLEILLFMGSGIVTSVPLLLFSRAAKKVSLATLGFLQFIGPSVQLYCGVTVFGEVFSSSRQVTFGLIWIALLIYVLDSAWFHRGASGRSGRLAKSHAA